MTNIESYYKAKAIDSFRTKVRMFLFSRLIRGREAIKWDDFKSFKITDELVEQQFENYWQKEETVKVNGVIINDITKNMARAETNAKDLLKELQTKYIESFHAVFPKKTFEKILDTEQCYYCGIGERTISELAKKRKLFKKNDRGWTLEMDRLNTNFEYSPGNAEMACYWCVNARTDEFTAEEFKANVGPGIRAIWEARLERKIN